MTKKVKTKKVPSTRRALLTSLFADLIDVTMNGFVAIVTGSVVMLARVFQGMADVVVDTLLLVGLNRSARTATRIHPFGFGKEAYFWTLLAGIIMLLFSATMSFYFGLREFLDPGEPIVSIWLAYAILSVNVLTNGYSMTVNARKLLEGRRWYDLPKVFVNTLHVAPRTTFALDSAGFLATLFGLAALLTYGLTGDGRFDGLGAMVVGMLLASSSVFLLMSAKTFIVGRRATPDVERTIKQAVLEVAGVNSVLDLRTMVLGHQGLLVNLEIHFQDDMVTDEIEQAVDDVKETVNRAVEGRVYIQVEPETPRKPRSRIAK